MLSPGHWNIWLCSTFRRLSHEPAQGTEKESWTFSPCMINKQKCHKSVRYHSSSIQLDTSVQAKFSCSSPLVPHTDCKAGWNNSQLCFQRGWKAQLSPLMSENVGPMLLTMQHKKREAGWGGKGSPEMQSCLLALWCRVIVTKVKATSLSLNALHCRWKAYLGTCNCFPVASEQLQL